MIKFSEKFFEIMEIIERLYKRNSTGEYTNILMKNLRTIDMATKFFSLLYGSAILIFFVSPIYSYAFNSERILPFAFYFPLIDPQTTDGYSITFFVQILFLIYALIGSTGFDIALLMCLYHCVSFAGKLIVRSEWYWTWNLT